jgi:cytochrome c peroxidase
MTLMNDSKRARSLTALSIILFVIMIALPFAEAESGPANSGRPTAPGITVKMLDQMSSLPGDFSPLLTVSPARAANAEMIELGKMLFFDNRLSLDRSMSCSTCHDPSKGFADGRALAIGFGGKQLGRHSPTILNAALNSAQFWDGRASSLEEQALGPITSAAEMNMTSEAELTGRLERVAEYNSRFRAVFGEGASFRNVARAIAAFEKTLITPDSPFDRYVSGDKQALTEQEKRGLILFVSKASCSQCHNGPNLADNKFHVLGEIQKGAQQSDAGRYGVTKDEKDRGAFKTPTLRNIALTAPYMHDGSVATLEEIVEFYDKGCGDAPNKSDLIFKLELTAQEKKDLVAFLKSLNGKPASLSLPQIPADN